MKLTSHQQVAFAVVFAGFMAIIYFISTPVERLYFFSSGISMIVIMNVIGYVKKAKLL